MISIIKNIELLCIILNIFKVTMDQSVFDITIFVKYDK